MMTTRLSSRSVQLFQAFSHPVLRQNWLPFTTTIAQQSKRPPYPDLVEDDLEEQFVRGHGPGGQSVNKTTNCVVLKHKPTRVFVKCHETRSLEKNRERARERLQDKLDLYWNGENCFIEQEKKRQSSQKKLKKKKTNERLEKLKEFKEREGLT